MNTISRIFFTFVGLTSTTQPHISRDVSVLPRFARRLCRNAAWSAGTASRRRRPRGRLLIGGRRVTSPRCFCARQPVYQGPYFSLPRESGQRSCSSEASEGRYDTAHSHSGHSDTSTLEEAAPLMADRRESVV